jgi:hypothetical protein
LVLDENDTRITIERNETINTLTITNLTHSDEALYACKATSNSTKFALKEGKLMVNGNELTITSVPYTPLKIYTLLKLKTKKHT